MNEKQQERQRQVNVVGSDDIGTAATEDMLAFSQIISAGQNPLAIAEEMERQIKKPPPKPAGLSEDEGIAAFAEFMSNGGEIKEDPMKILAQQRKIEEQENAAIELQSLQQNDATAAFAGLVDSQVIQQKAQMYEGSGNINAQEALQSSIQSSKQSTKKSAEALSMVQQQSEEDLQQANKLVEVTDTAKQAVENGIIIPQTNPIQPKQQSKIQTNKQEGQESRSKISSAIEKLNQGFTVEDVRKFQQKQLQTKKQPQKVPNAQKKANVPKSADLMIGQSTEENQIIQQQSASQSQKEEDAQVDAQAEEILNQIKSAAIGIKGIGGNSGIDDTQLKAALGEMNLLQLNSDIKLDFENDDDSKFDSNAKEALNFLSERFPEDYPEDHVIPKKIEPSPKELAEKEKQSQLDYSKKVAQEASDYNEQLIKVNQDNEEKEKIKMMIQEYNLDSEKLRNKNSKKVNLAQISSFSDNDQNSKQIDDKDSNFDENASLALEFLSQQFPSDYPQDHIPIPKKEASPQELAEQEKQKMLDYSKKIAEEAAEYTQKLIQEKQDKEEQEKLQRMGLDGEPVALQIKKMKRDNGLQINLAQVSSQINENQLDILQALKNGNQISEADIANLKDEDLDALNQNLNQLDLQEGSITTESQNEVQKQKTMQKTQTSETAQVQNSEEMKQFSESIAQAADIVTNESDNDKSKGDFDDTSFFDLKKQAIEAAKAEKLQQLSQQQSRPQVKKQIIKAKPVVINQVQQLKQVAEASPLQSLPEQNDPELEAKAAIVAQTEAANQAAIEDTTNSLSKPVNHNQKILFKFKEQSAQQQKIKYEADKQSALDQGFTLEQAERYALEEQYQSKIKQETIQEANSQIVAAENQVQQQIIQGSDQSGQIETLDNKKKDQLTGNTPMTKPMSGPGGAPPTHKDDDKTASQKSKKLIQEPVLDQGLAQQQSQNELSIQEQINIAQNQQNQIKAALEKKKQEKLNQNNIKNSQQQQQDLEKQAEEQALAEATAQYEAQEQLEKQKKAQQQQQPNLPIKQQPEIAQQPSQQIQAPEQISQVQNPITQPVIQQVSQTQSQVQQPVLQQVSKTQNPVQQPVAQQVIQKQEQQIQNTKTVQEIIQTPNEKPKLIQQNQITQAKQNEQQNINQAQQQESQNLTQQNQESQASQQENQSQENPQNNIKVTEKQTIQENSEINRHVPKHLKNKIGKKLKERAIKYEDDLNKARDEIQIAQNEMKNIDVEVANFHQKMGKSMHSLLQAFTEGFEAVSQAKKAQEDDEEEEEDSNDVELTQRRMEKFDKIHSGISNLEALTSQLKLSINDDNSNNENIQIDQALVNQKHEIKQIPKTQSVQQPLKQIKNVQQNKIVPAQNIINNQLGKQNASPSQNQQKAAQNKQNVAKRNLIQAKITNFNNAKKNSVQNQQKQQIKGTAKQVVQQKKMINPKINQKQIKKPIQKIDSKKPQKLQKQIQNKNVKPQKKVVQTKKPLAQKLQKPVSKMLIQNHLKANKINNLAKKKPQQNLNKKPLKLVQINQKESEDEKLLQSLNAEEKLKSLLETREQLRHIGQAIGKNRKASSKNIENLAQSLGIKMDDQMKKDAEKMSSNQLIANKIAEKVLLQVSNKKQKSDLKKDSKNQLKLSQVSQLDNSPDSSMLLQLDESMDSYNKLKDDDYGDEIYIFEAQEDQTAEDKEQEEQQLQEVIQIREADQKIRKADTHNQQSDDDDN